MVKPKYNKIVISGGSVKGFAALGALQYVKDNGMLDEVKTYIGSSIGSIIGYLLCIGYTPIECMVHVCTNRLFDNISSNLDIVSFTNGTGAINYNIIMEFLEKLTVDKIGRYITLGELKKKFDKELICSAYNFTKKQQEFFTPDTDPDMPCLTALRISSNIPLLFNRFKYMSSYYLDGGLGNNFPLNLLNKDDVTLGIYLCSGNRVEDINAEFNLQKYIYKIIMIPISQNGNYLMKNYGHLCTDYVKIGVDAKIVDLELSNAQKLDLFSVGFRWMEDYYTNKEKNMQILENSEPPPGGGFQEIGTQTDD